MRRRLCTVAAEAAAKPAEAEGGLGWLMRAGQVDAGFFQGSALFAGVIIGIQVSSEQQRAAVLDSLIAGYRAFGLSEEHVSDRQLIEDFVRKNVAAAANVVMASPVFYFMFAKVMKESILVSSVRAITGTFRIVPFMGFFYGAFALISPFLVDFFMGRGQSYAEANGTSGIVMILSGFVLIEAVVELRGCGVLFSQARRRRAAWPSVRGRAAPRRCPLVPRPTVADDRLVLLHLRARAGGPPRHGSAHAAAEDRPGGRRLHTARVVARGLDGAAAHVPALRAAAHRQ